MEAVVVEGLEDDLLNKASAENGLTLTSFFLMDKSIEGADAFNKADSFFKFKPLPLGKEVGVATGLFCKCRFSPLLLPIGLPLVRSRAWLASEAVDSLALAKSAYGLV